MKVLVADDSGIMRKIIIRSLNAVGVSDIVEAADGQEAIDAYKAEPVDLILTDSRVGINRANHHGDDRSSEKPGDRGDPSWSERLPN
jgi:chemotaxis response regulator CheB